MLLCDERMDQNRDLVDSEGNKIEHLLSTENFQIDPDNIHPMSLFNREDMINYVQDHEELLRREKVIGE